MVQRLCLFLWWAASASSATSSFYSPVGYFGIASEHNGMKYPHQGITITNNNGIVIGGWAGSSNYWSSTYEYTHYPTGMLVSTPGLTSTDLESIEAVDEGGSLPEASYTQGVAYSSSNSLIVLAGYTKGNMKQASGNRFNGDGNTCEYSECTTDAWLAAFNTAGVFQWGRQYSSGQPSQYTQITSHVDMFTAVAVNGDQIWATGHSNEVISSSYTNQGSYDIIRVALYTSGSEINTFQEGSTGDDRAWGIVFNGNQEHFVGGETEGNWDNNNAGSWDILLIKYGASGTKDWAIVYGGSAWDEFAAMQISSAGDIYICGNTKGYLAASHAGGTYDYFLAKFSGSNGANEWTVQRGTSYSEYVEGFWIASTGNFLLAGTIESGSYAAATMDGQSGYGYDDAFLVELEASNSGAPTHKSTQLHGHSSYDEIGRGVVQVGNGNIYLIGEVRDTFVHDTYNQGLDIFVQLITTTTTTDTTTSATQTTVSSTSLTSSSSTATSVTKTTSTSSSVTTTSSSSSSSTTSSTTTASNTTTTTETTTSSTFSKTSSTSSTQTNTSSTMTTHTRTTTTSLSSSQTTTSSSATSTLSSTSTLTSSSSRSSTTSSTVSSTTSSTTSITGTTSSTTSSTASISSTVSSTTSMSSTVSSTTSISSTGSSTTSLTSLTVVLPADQTSLPADQTSQINSDSSNPGVTTVVTTVATTVAVSTTAAAVVCSTLPSGPGVLAADCVGKIAGESCQVLCAAGFEGGPTQYTCNAAGVFDGPSSTPCQQPTCPVDQLPSNLDTTCENTPFGGFCFVRCPQGFAFAEAIYTCETSGTFAGTPPTCNPLRCSSDSLPQDYRLNVSSCIGATAGESCQITCKYGFESTVPASDVQCANDGNFLAAAVPSCSPKKCSAPTPSTSAVVPWATDCEGVTHGQTCMAICTAGHSGAAAQFLCENGEILGVEPSCVPLPCQFSGEVLVGVDTSPCSGTTTGSSCQRQCIFGYEGLGDPGMICQSDGTFSYSQFQCQPISCGKLSDTSPFNEAEFKDSCQALTFGQSCSVLCETGWQMQGDAVNMVCSNTPAHSAGYASDGLPAANSTPPTCIGKTCTARLPNIRGATHDCENKTTLETCTVDAAVGFTSNGATTLQCGTDGEFKGAFPVITAAVCPTPTFGTGVASTCADKTIGAECWAYCLAGYTGSPQAYLCTADVSGAQVMPVSSSISCSVRRLALIEPRRLAAGCGTAAATALGLTMEFEHSCSALSDTEICISHCSFGWTLNGDASILTCQDGTLTGSLPSCTPVACSYNLPSALGVAHNCTDVTTGSTCVATCGAPGYTYGSGSPEVFECLATGEFQGQNPSCVPLSCQNLTLSSEFEHNCRGMFFQDACAVSCAEGYTIAGPASQYICGESGTVQGTLPSCTANPCTNTISPEIFQASCDGVTTGQSCSVSCQAGMIPNSANMSCHSSGFLVGTLPSCLPAQCPTNSALEAASVAHNCQNASFGQSCSVYCAAGYKLTQGAGQVWQCDLSGGSLALSGSLPSCKALTCSIELNPSDSMTDNCSAELEVGDSCIQSCRKGYFQNGSAAESIVCNLDLSIDGGTRPNCESINCDTSQLSVLFPSLQHSCAGVTANRSCFAFCQAGYVAQEGVIEWTCAERQSTENLSQSVDGFALHGEIPNCVAQVCLYNMPTGEGLSHDCENVSTDQTCVVSCGAGWSGNSETYTCGSDRVLTGTPVSCTVTATTNSISTTTATTLTLFVTGVITLEPRQEPSLALEYKDLLDKFTTDPNLTQAVATAVASVLNVSIDAVELNMTIANITIASDARRLLDMKEVVLVEYACSRSFASLALARDWATAVTLEEVTAAINENLGSSNVRAEVLDFELQVTGLPAPDSQAPERPGVPWLLILLACSPCILLVAGLFFAKVCLPSKAEQAQPAQVGGQAAEIDPEDPNVDNVLEAEAHEEAETQANAVKVQAASVPDAELELETMLQEVGVQFYEPSPEEMAAGDAPSSPAELDEMDGLRFLP